MNNPALKGEVSQTNKKMLTQIKLHGIFGVLRFPNKMESVLPEAMSSGFQIHFSHSAKLIKTKVLTNLEFNSRGLVSSLLSNHDFQKINLMEHGSPPLFENRGIRA